ncbi:hypothetical protein C8Q74DRAFT_1295149 [Fomes fomentarius]|nr:hypothetical protein C8Q74DRAFT_1295149 [Fomes fomentarius]
MVGLDGRETGQAEWRFVVRKCGMRGVCMAAGESLLSPFVSVLNLIACPRTPRRLLHADKYCTCCCVAAAIALLIVIAVIKIRGVLLVSRSCDYCRPSTDDASRCRLSLAALGHCVLVRSIAALLDTAFTMRFGVAVGHSLH